MQPWWTQQTGIWFGALGGSALGLLGGLLGTAAGIWANQAKHRTLVLGTFGLTSALGNLALVAGILAAILRQPYHVFYPLLLLGFIGTCVMTSLYFVVRARYNQAEQRKIDAAGLRNS